MEIPSQQSIHVLVFAIEAVSVHTLAGISSKAVILVAAVELVQWHLQKNCPASIQRALNQGSARIPPE